MKNLSTFQMVLFAVFIVAAIIAVVIFAGFGGTGEQPEVGGDVVIWGTVSNRTMNQIVSNITSENDGFSLLYVEKNPETYEEELVSALASGVGPDLFMLPHKLLLRNSSKIFPIPYETIGRRDYLNTYVEAGELFLTRSGALALPLFIDPMVLYWNRDLFSEAGLAAPPKNWSEVLGQTPTLTKRDSRGNILQSAIGLGDFFNIKSAEDILAMLLMQLGDSIVARDEEDGLYVTFGERVGNQISAAESAVRFFNQFSNIDLSVYTWNRSLPSSEDAFANGFLAMYLGYASEYFEVRDRNPHLNFDIAQAPQKIEGRPATFANIHSIAVAKNSPNISGAVYIAFELANAQNSTELADTLGLASARRDIVSLGIDDPIFDIFYKSALIARGWLDPSPEDTQEIFRDMIDSVVAGRSDVDDAVSRASRQLENLVMNLFR